MKCSFCGQEINENLIGINGNQANICINCLKVGIEECDSISIDKNSNHKLLKPHELKCELDKYIVGQEEAKKLLSVELYNHYKRINKKIEGIDIQKTNLMLVGPTGSGKTYLMQVLAKILNVPLQIGDATALTSAGYVGKDVESLLLGLYTKANGDIKAMQRGIIYIDEIDKIVSRDNKNKNLEPGGQGVQQSLLKMLEGAEVSFDIPSGIAGKTSITVNTNNILFICGGAFDGIENIVRERKGLNNLNNIGFNVSLNNENESTTYNSNSLKVEPEDLIKYGFLEEFIGRIPLVATLVKLTNLELLDILTKSKNSIIKQYQALLKMDDVSLEFEKEALNYIVEEAQKRNIGARGLRGIIADKMNNIMFDIPQNEIKEFKVTKQYLSE